MLLLCICTIAQLVLERRIRYRLIELFIFASALMFLVGDLFSVTVVNVTRMWPFFIILIDMCLVFNIPQRTSITLISILLTWLAILAVEDVVRFGLYDLSFLPSQSDRRDTVTCNTLPCKLSVVDGISSFTQQAFIFLLDFHFTREFARDLFKEHEKMNKVIDATEQIATSLSRFDLSLAEEVISGASLPPPLHDAFRRILSNLHMYRPYLPHSCLLNEEFTDSSCELASRTERPKSSSGSSQRVDINDTVKTRRCTFTVTNMLGSHKEAASDISLYQDKYRQFMERVVTCFSRVSGVVGVVVGDHVHSSFNSSKSCTSHAKSAVQGSLDLFVSLQAVGIDVVTGVASGTALCGSLGCSDLMSVVMIGPSAVTASLLQEFSRDKGHRIACCGATYGEVSFAFTMKIILGRVKVTKGEAEGMELAYEVVVGENEAKEVSEEEWMYQLEESPWETYNMAGKLYLLGNCGEALRLLGIKRQRSSVVVEAEEGLMSQLMGSE